MNKRLNKLNNSGLTFPSYNEDILHVAALLVVIFIGDLVPTVNIDTGHLLQPLVDLRSAKELIKQKVTRLHPIRLNTAMELFARVVFIN
jgi:hypothetical protein